MAGQGTNRQPDTWLTLNRMPVERSAHVGIRLDWPNDAVTVALPGGLVLHIYGDGQVWRDDTSGYFNIHDEEIDWR